MENSVLGNALEGVPEESEEEEEQPKNSNIENADNLDGQYKSYFIYFIFLKVVIMLCLILIPDTENEVLQTPHLLVKSVMCSPKSQVHRACCHAHFFFFFFKILVIENHWISSHVNAVKGIKLV